MNDARDSAFKPPSEREAAGGGLGTLFRSVRSVARSGRDAARVLASQGADALEQQALTALKRRLDSLPGLQALPASHPRPSPAARFQERLARSAELSGGRSQEAFFTQLILQMLPDEARLAAHVLNLPRALPVVHVEAVSRLLGSGGERVAPCLSTAGDDAGMRAPELAPVFLQRLCTSGLLEPGAERLSAADQYQLIETSADLRAVCARIEEDGQKARLVRRSLRVTPLGTQFRAACADRPATRR